MDGQGDRVRWISAPVECLTIWKIKEDFALSSVSISMPLASDSIFNGGFSNCP